VLGVMGSITGKNLLGEHLEDLSQGPNVRTHCHSTRMILRHCLVRNSLKSIFREERIRNMRVLDVMGSITGKNSLVEHLEDLSHDPNVHTHCHRERMISGFCRVRNSLKSIFIEKRIGNMRVSDVMGSFTFKHVEDEQLEVLPAITANDKVHLTPTGYKALALGLVKS
jgi:hypothetical protein